MDLDTGPQAAGFVSPWISLQGVILYGVMLNLPFTFTPETEVGIRNTRRKTTETLRTAEVTEKFLNAQKG